MMVHRNDEESIQAVRMFALNLAKKVNQSEPSWHYSKPELDIFLEQWLTCMSSIVSKSEINRIVKGEQSNDELEQKISFILINAHIASDEFIKSIVKHVVGENGVHDKIEALIEALKPHIRSCAALNRTPEDFEKRAAIEIVNNYLSDGQFVEALLKRKQSPHYDNLIRKTQKYFKNIALSHNLVSKPEQAEDLIQTIWLKILEKLPGFHFLSRFHVWAVSILFQEYRNQKRYEEAGKRGGGTKPISLDAPLNKDNPEQALHEKIHSENLNPEDELLYRELIALVSKHIDKMQEEREKIIARWRLLELMTPKEIAKKLNMSPKQVSTIVFRIRAFLRNNPDLTKD